MTPIILSADDYALNPEIDIAILDLIRHGLLTAASCLVLSPRWPEAAQMLETPIRSQANIGLHLDFTEFSQPLRHPLPALIACTTARLLSAKAVSRSIQTQLDRFENALGSAPDYIDGHQHVHQLPQIRDALVTILEQRYGNNVPWIRLSRPAGNNSKEKIIRLLGARSLANKARLAGLSHPDWLLGVYGFDLDEMAYRARLEMWLMQAAELRPQVCMLMCHPASALSKADAIGEARVREYRVLSAELGVLLERYKLRPARGDVLAHASTAAA